MSAEWVVLGVLIIVGVPIIAANILVGQWRKREYDNEREDAAL